MVPKVYMKKRHRAILIVGQRDSGARRLFVDAPMSVIGDTVSTFVLLPEMSQFDTSTGYRQFMWPVPILVL